MNIEISYESKEEWDIPWEEIIHRVVVGVLDYAGCPYETEVNVLIADDPRIRELNTEFREIEKTTDVLSFPIIDFPLAGDFDFLEEEAGDIYFHPESGELMLGDIAVSAQKVREQAEEYGHSMERELAFLIAHSMFHLMGYDHMEEAEREVMENKQREVLDLLEIVR